MPGANPSTTPTLLALDQEVQGRIFRLDRETTLIGRDSSCDVVLGRESKVVSSKHALITRRADGFYLEDLGSLNGTRVEGNRITAPVLLRDGDRIKICNYTMLFHIPRVAVTDDGGSMMILGTLDASSLDTIAFPSGPEQKLRYVLEISRNLGGALSLNEVLDRTLETLFAIFPQADRGFVILNIRMEHLAPDAIRTRRDDPRDLAVVRPIFEKVINKGQAILSTDDPSSTQGVAQSSKRTTMCVPLLDRQRRPTGVLQIDTRDERCRFSQDDLDLLVAVATQVGLAVENTRLHEEMLELIKTRQEAEDAVAVQKALLPQSRPELAGYEFWDYYEPARFVGGDYFDYIPISRPGDSLDAPARRLIVALGDVAGKGMPAALLMARLSAGVRLIAPTGLEPTRVVERLNRDLYSSGFAAMFATFLLVLIDGADHKMTVVNAGHLAPLIRRREGRVDKIGEEEAGYPLGVFEDTTYQCVTTPLKPGDVVILYTDGVTDAVNARDEGFGAERLKKSILAAPALPPQLGDSILKDIQAHVGGAAWADDITLLSFGRTPSPPTPRR